MDRIDKAAMLAPPSPRLWVVEGPRHPRFGWDRKYIERYGQEFSPWYFAKNCAAVLGHVRAHGLTPVMSQMAEHLVTIAQPHIQAIGNYRYVRNDFAYEYLWHVFRPPFYGAFMNNVTAHGLMQLYEATRSERYLLLADRLLMTSVDPDAPIPLCSDGWLHEYVFHTDSRIPGVQLSGTRGWLTARIYNGHISALLALMRFQAMTGFDGYATAITAAVETMAVWLPRQPYEGRYFSYTPDMPSYPDYGQKRACHLAEALADLTRDSRILAASKDARALYESIASREQEVISTAMKELRAVVRAADL